MKSAYVLSTNRALFDVFAQLVAENDGEVSLKAREARLYFDDIMLLAYEIDAHSDIDLQAPATDFRHCDDPGDLTQFAVFIIECRSEGVFVHWVARLSERIDDPLWVLDGDGVLWGAKHLDAGQIRL